MPSAWSGPLGQSRVLLLLLGLLFASASPLQVSVDGPASQDALVPPEESYHGIVDERYTLPTLPGTGDPLNKYFSEPAVANGHYDLRYYTNEVPYNEHHLALRHLIRSYLAIMRKHGVETWLAHGTLLGWWWNGAIMPWDADLDVQVSHRTLNWMASTLNNTEHVYYHKIASHAGNPLEDERYDDDYDDDDDAEYVEATRTASSPRPTLGMGSSSSPSPSPSPRSRSRPDIRDNTHQRRTYLLDVNPHHDELDRGDGMNVIDARWIDTSNGLFIDITALRERHYDRPGLWSCKNDHYYPSRDLWPMRVSRFEGARVRIPYSFEKILTQEYGTQCLVLEEYEGHRWHSDVKQWRKMTPLELQEREDRARDRWRDQMIRDGQIQDSGE